MLVCEYCETIGHPFNLCPILRCHPLLAQDFGDFFNPRTFPIRRVPTRCCQSALEDNGQIVGEERKAGAGEEHKAAAEVEALELTLVLREIDASFLEVQPQDLSYSRKK